MLNLRTAVHQELLTLHPRCYFLDAPDTATFPYIVYSFNPVNDDGESMQLVILDIDGWDDNSDTTELEELMVTMNQINKKVIQSNDVTIVFYLDTKIPLIDEDTRLHRRKYTYTGKLFERG